MTSLLNKVYYAVKPVIPRRAAIAARQWRARRIRAAAVDAWPIDDRCGCSPPGWSGWPGGKQFALVLTHDVEGPLGLGRVEQLLELDAKHGFRSSVNFVPEDSYPVRGELLQSLETAGFEVGVHGLSHDGKLYFSKAGFRSKALRINRYVSEWKAAGFRSPCMHHDLEALHALDIEYDSSTFDTDPFEPEPDGVGTIFPFWVAGPDGHGYVELPCTLPQDFTVFVTLGEKSIDIWKRKLDWIAERGGMALLDTHPDYMDFDHTGARFEYPPSLYEEFLQYARDRYDGAFWSALPRDVSRFYMASRSPAVLTG